MSKKDGKHSNSNDSALFRELVDGVRPIDTPKRHHDPGKPPPARARSRQLDEQNVLHESLHGDEDPSETETGDELSYRRDHIQPRTLKRLRRGDFAVQESLDLHGLNSSEAHEALREFLAHSLQKGFRCVRIVHGKGLGSGPRGPVLKHKVNIWLRKWDDVVAFASAPPHDGGTGAVYVLLKTR